MKLGVRLLLRVIVLVAVLIVMLRISQRALQPPPAPPEIQVDLVSPQASARSQPIATNEVPQIRYNFQGMPVMAIFSVYEGLCGKKLQVDSRVSLSTTVKIVTDHPLTTNQAMQVIEQALKTQAHAQIIKKDDGNLSVVPASP